MTRRTASRILVGMSRITFLFAFVGVAAVIGIARPSEAAAGWCWPNCSDYGILGPSTSSNNGCWYTGEVCSGWGFWYLNGVAKTCYPGCDYWGNTRGQILYGFENGQRIRGYFSWAPGKSYIRPGEVGMGGYLRAQVNYWQGTSSQVNVAAIQ